MASLRGHWPVVAVFVAFALSALIVPTFAAVATTDDWAYTRSAQILLAEGRLTVFPVVAATAVFQIVWGALFGLLLGPTFGVYRLSTVIISALGALALYGLCRELGVSPRRSALGVAAHLFNPLAFVLAFTFMTDAHFVALLVIATWLYVRAISRESSPMPEPEIAPPRRRFGLPRAATADTNVRLLVAGSVVATLAFLTRQQGALIVPGVVTFLIVTRRLGFDRQSVKLLLQLVLPVVLGATGYYVWLRFGNDVPRIQTTFLREVLDEGWSGTWWLVRRLTVVELMYLGFFALPIAAAALPAVGQLIAGIPRRGWVLVAIWQAVLLVGVTALWSRGALMPYIAQFYGAAGLGPPDILGSRPVLLGPDVRKILTVICLVASLVLALLAARGLAARSSPDRSRAGLVLAIGLWQVIGVFPPSYHYIGWAAGSLDRYLLPLAPLAIALALWSLRGVRLALPLGWIVAIGLALFAIAGTRDYLVFLRAVWATADQALAEGVPIDRLDAGSAWDGYHLYELGLEHAIRSRTPKGGPWWVYFYAPATDSAVVVSSKPQPGYLVVGQRSYSSWLLPQSPRLYLLRRWGTTWPPSSASGAAETESDSERAEPSSTPVPRPTTAPMPTVTAGNGLNTGSAGAGD